MKQSKNPTQWWIWILFIRWKSAADAVQMWRSLVQLFHQQQDLINKLPSADTLTPLPQLTDNKGLQCAYMQILRLFEVQNVVLWCFPAQIGHYYCVCHVFCVLCEGRLQLHLLKCIRVFEMFHNLCEWVKCANMWENSSIQLQLFVQLMWLLLSAFKNVSEEY